MGQEVFVGVTAGVGAAQDEGQLTMKAQKKRKSAVAAVAYGEEESCY